MRVNIVIAFVLLFAASVVTAQENQSPKVSPAPPSQVTPEMQDEHAKHYRFVFTSLAGVPDVDAAIALPVNKNREKVTITLNPASRPEVDGGSRAIVVFATDRANVIVVGRPVAVHPHLTSNRSFVFSDYEFYVDRVLKNDGAPLGSMIVVGCPGGILDYRGKIVETVYPNFEPFSLNDTYLLFLTRIPETGAFQADAYEIYLLKDGKTIPAMTNLPPTAFGDAESFEAEVKREVVSNQSMRVIHPLREARGKERQ